MPPPGHSAGKGTHLLKLHVSRSPTVAVIISLSSTHVVPGSVQSTLNAFVVIPHWDPVFWTGKLSLGTAEQLSSSDGVGGGAGAQALLADSSESTNAWLLSELGGDAGRKTARLNDTVGVTGGRGGGDGSGSPSAAGRGRTPPGSWGLSQEFTGRTLASPRTRGAGRPPPRPRPVTRLQAAVWVPISVSECRLYGLITSFAKSEIRTQVVATRPRWTLNATSPAAVGPPPASGRSRPPPSSLTRLLQTCFRSAPASLLCPGAPGP